METINSIEELRIAIQLLEIEQSIKKQQLKDHLHLIHESLKPINLIRSTISEVTSSPILIDNILGASIGLASGYLSRKLVVSGSHNIIRKIFGAVIQFGVTNFVAQKSGPLKSVRQYIKEHFLHHEEPNSE